MNQTVKIVSVIICVTFILLGYIAQTVCHIKLSYRILHYNRELSRRYEQERCLRYELTALSSPAALEERCAKNRLDLTVPSAVRFLRLPPSDRAAVGKGGSAADEGAFKPVHFTSFAQAGTSSSEKRN